MFQCRTRLCGWCSSMDESQSKSRCFVSMPHAALWVVQPHLDDDEGVLLFTSFNAARGFVGGAASNRRICFAELIAVSMPHAALWVVQPSPPECTHALRGCFNAARGFVGGAAFDISA